MTTRHHLPESPLPPPEPVRVTMADVWAVVAESWAGIVAAWVVGLATVFLTWNGSLFG